MEVISNEIGTIETINNKTCNKCKLEKEETFFYKNRKECKTCYNGHRLCMHDIQRTHCKKCGGSQICKHNIQKSTCRDCPEGGSSFCEHLDSNDKKRQKSNCIICNKGNFCIHLIQRSHCRECNGKSICIIIKENIIV
jgi:hypothetical protein